MVPKNDLIYRPKYLSEICITLMVVTHFMLSSTMFSGRQGRHGRANRTWSVWSLTLLLTLTICSVRSISLGMHSCCRSVVILYCCFACLSLLSVQFQIILLIHSLFVSCLIYCVAKWCCLVVILYQSLFKIGVRITNLPKSIAEGDLKELFRKYGTVSHVFCPKPLQVTLWNPNNPNEGKAVVRFLDRKAAEDAVLEMNGATVLGQMLKLVLIQPQCWPSERSRRYFWSDSKQPVRQCSQERTASSRPFGSAMQKHLEILRRACLVAVFIGRQESSNYIHCLILLPRVL